MKKICILIAAVACTTFGYSQTAQQKVEKQLQDPQRKANAGKADAIIANKKNLFDSTTFSNKTVDAVDGKVVKASTKKKQCCSKPKQSSSSASASKKKV
jgi:hypothetical protein